MVRLRAYTLREALRLYDGSDIELSDGSLQEIVNTLDDNISQIPTDGDKGELNKKYGMRDDIMKALSDIAVDLANLNTFV